VSDSPIHPQGDLIGGLPPAELDRAAFLAAIVDSSDDAIVGKTLDGVIRSWNRGAERIFGYRANEAVGRSITLIIPPDRLDEEKEILARLARGESIEHYETVRMAKGGRRVDVSLTVSPVRDAAGRIVGASKVARDVGARKQAELARRESEERFRALADNIAQLAWMADPGGRITWYNRRWFDYTGTTPEEMDGAGWWEILHPDHVARVRDRLLRSVATGQVWEDTFPLRGADGGYRWFLSRAVPIHGETGTVERWFGTHTDITERMEMEEALRQADRRKDEFLATLAHELRNPLAPIRTGIELLRQAGGDARLTARVQATLERQTAQLVRLVDDLLDVSRITSGKMDLQREDVELAGLVRSALEASAPQIDAKEQELVVALPEAPVWLDADPVRLSQVLANLLNNAAKYSPRRGRIELSAEVGDGEVTIEVADSGPGIPAPLRERIFDMFVQLPGDDGHFRSGLGIGLTLVKSLVEMHGGSVRAADRPGSTGSAFVVRLPRLARPPSTPEERPAGRAATAGPPLRVLVVDDNLDAADTLRALLAARGHQVRAVYDGETALAAAAEIQPQLVLLDLGMPGLDGYETAQRLRHAHATPPVLVAVTGWGQRADRRRVRAAGFDHHLVKPADLGALQAILDQVAAARAPSR
jgi:PAS domain S-box-containing protein